MPSTPTTRNYAELQAVGENLNTWGTKNNGVISLFDYALDGMTSFTLSGTKTLSTTSYANNEANARFVNITSGTGGTVTIPNTEKVRLVRNNTSGNVVFTTGSGTTATVAAGRIVWVICDGANTVYKAAETPTPLVIADGGTGATDAATARTNLGIVPSAMTFISETTITNGVTEVDIETPFSDTSYDGFEFHFYATISGLGQLNARIKKSGAYQSGNYQSYALAVPSNSLTVADRVLMTTNTSTGFSGSLRISRVGAGSEMMISGESSNDANVGHWFQSRHITAGALQGLRFYGGTFTGGRVRVYGIKAS